MTPIEDFVAAVAVEDSLAGEVYVSVFSVSATSACVAQGIAERKAREAISALIRSPIALSLCELWAKGLTFSLQILLRDNIPSEITWAAAKA